VLNAEDPRLPVWHGLAGDRRRIEFGCEQGDVRLARPPEATAAGWRLAITTPVGDFEAELPLPGRHNIVNALAAVAAGIVLGLNEDALCQGLARAQAEPGRMQVLTGRGGSRLINDAYNANPASLAAAADWLAGQSGTRWVAFGDMGELGENAEMAHREAGRVLRKAGVKRLFTVGPLAALAAESFGQGAARFQDIDQAAEAIARDLGPDVTLLVKASRSAGLEGLVAALREETSSAATGDR
jgi:UDP-N-acetylmuramoyl-tripeptide--D-alanyl-D-alanine ligase